MRSLGLKLADHKTEAVLFTSRKQVENITLDMGKCTITSEPSIRYLEVMLDRRLSFKLHIEHAAVKATSAHSISGAHAKHRWTTATSEETLSVSRNLHTHVYNSHLG